MDILFPHKIIRIFSLILFSCNLVFSKNPIITLHFFLFFLLFFFFSKKFLSNANVVFRIAQPFKHQTCFLPTLRVFVQAASWWSCWVISQHKMCFQKIPKWTIIIIVFAILQSIYAAGKIPQFLHFSTILNHFLNIFYHYFWRKNSNLNFQKRLLFL